ncbi:formyltetrahydrofolate deformylase [Friedmanniella endophytica]|uniref:Formyltetrahydrofolate deformylase n=1 Tax=Microlunatus kandeliicorticis TaxID=1759536 RepID=A0A7W3IUM1_9ACTN|nr:formyltetrahydrofolate deformylase [Microlunatus kandeliicorticis]MBA8795573.1 formyltetrahydrofolate deformylase [Microlunatus kandeliicorticis]
MTPSDPAPASARPGIGRLLVSCPDQPGIVAAVTAFLFERGANITHSDQYSSDPVGGGRFFLRMAFSLDGLADRLDALAAEFDARVGQRYAMEARFTDAARPKRISIFVSRYDHCLLDLLWRWQRGTLGVEVASVIANHDDLRPEVERFGVPFHHIPVTRETKPAAEAEQLRLLTGDAGTTGAGPGIDFVVLARYMQILSADLLDRLGRHGIPAINIHHSFLPAFAGAKPYDQAKRRGVKLIGATAHFVTADLDEGPIIEQDVVRVTHEATPADLTRWGADIERAVLSRAVRWQAEDRILLNGATTVVF